MKAVVIYESMYGNTHLIANAIAEGLRAHGEVTVVPVAEARATVVEDADLVVVGGPTHAHGMSRTATRKGAVDAARKPGSDLVLEAPEAPDDTSSASGSRQSANARSLRRRSIRESISRRHSPDAPRKALPASSAIRVPSCC